MKQFERELGRALKRRENKPYVRCVYYDLSRTIDCGFKDCYPTQRENGEVEMRGCQSCNGYNISCEVYKEMNK